MPVLLAYHLDRSVLVRSPKLNHVGQKRGGEVVEIKYWRGLPHLTVHLPSRGEKCRFILKPVSNTVGDLAQMIKAEDKGVDRVVIFTKDGVKIASSTTIEMLLLEDSASLRINDQIYNIRIPESERKIFSKNDADKLSDVRMLISQLYDSLQVKEFHVHKEKELLAQMELLKSSLEPMEEKRFELERKSNAKTSLLTWVGLGMMSVQFGILARLTWWEYSWDIMEPVTYFVTYGTAMAVYAYFAITKQDYLLPDVRDRQYLITLHKNARKAGFDLQRYNALKEQLNAIQSDLNRLRDPLIPPHQAASRTSTNYDPYFSSGNSYYDNVKEYFNAILGKGK